MFCQPLERQRAKTAYTGTRRPDTKIEWKRFLSDKTTVLCLISNGVNSESDAYVKQAVEEMLSDPDQRAALLDPANANMEFGIARQDANIWLVVALSSDYADFESPPHIKSSEIAMKGRLKNGAKVVNDRESRTTSDGLRVEIYYDSLPSRLSPGQLARTSCVDLGLMRTRLLRPLKGSSYLNLAYSVQLPGCPNPQEVSTFAETPLSAEQDVEIRMQAMREAESIVRNQTGVLIVASEWDIEGESFSIRADLSELLTRFGDGLYTAVVYGSVGGERYVVAEYPMIVDADR